MLEFCKDVLLKVSFNRKLFKKELKKSVSWLNKRDRVMLRAWCLTTFGSLYGDVILDVFRGVVRLIGQHEQHRVFAHISFGTPHKLRDIEHFIR